MRRAARGCSPRSTGSPPNAPPAAAPTKPQVQLECFANPQPDRDYTIRISIPEFTCLCPKTGQPDFAQLELEYVPAGRCIELKSLKLYIHSYRNLGIFYENAVNRILQDVVSACRPVWAVVTGEFTARGGLSSTIEAKYP